jgi:hypothetical protein
MGNFFHSSEQIRKKKSSQLNIKKRSEMAWTLHAVRICPRHKMPGKYYTRQWTSNPKVNPILSHKLQSIPRTLQNQVSCHSVSWPLPPNIWHTCIWLCLFLAKQTGNNPGLGFFCFLVKLLDMSRTQPHKLATKAFWHYDSKSHNNGYHIDK